MLLYSAVSSPLECSMCFTLHSLAGLSFRHQLDFSGKHSVMLQLLCKDDSLIFPLLSTARYSFMSEHRGIVEITKMPTLRNSSNGDSDSRSKQSGANQGQGWETIQRALRC